MGARLPIRLDGRHDARPPEPDARPSIALAFEQLQAVDMARDGPGAPAQGEPRFDCYAVCLQALGEAGKRCNPTRGCLGPPCLEGVPPALSHERQQGPAQRIGLRDRGVRLER